MRRNPWKVEKPKKPNLINEVVDRQGNEYFIDIDEDTFNLRPDNTPIVVYWYADEEQIRGKKKPKTKTVTVLKNKKILKGFLELMKVEVEAVDELEETAASVATSSDAA